jgi:hypothetical protein
MLYSISIKSAKYWELPWQKWKIGEKSENHLSKKICYISSFELHSNRGSKNTKFDNLEKEIQNKCVIVKK